MNWELVTFYTQNYEKYFRRLKESCDALGLSVKGYAAPGDAEWVLNCAKKALFIERAIKETDAEYVVWTDADSTVQRYPSLFDCFKGTIGAHIRKRRLGRNNLLSGTMIFNVRESASVIERWKKRLEENPREWDQRALQAILEPGELVRIPASYCCIFDAPDMLAACDGKPVILHHQASRNEKHRH
jgi:hypothetical protein